MRNSNSRHRPLILSKETLVVVARYCTADADEVLFRSGVLGIKVKIMLPWDPTGKTGPKKPLPDHVSIVEPKEEVIPTTPMTEHKGGKPEQPAAPAPAAPVM